jgi:hypothetical protein
MVEVLKPHMFPRLQELAANPYRPPEIVALKEWIAGETRALEVRVALMGGVIDPEARRRVQAVVQAKLRLDALYNAWVKGEIG